MKSISDNWIIRNLENAIATWNDKLAELWQLITQTPESFKGGAIWGVIVNINSALIGIGYGLLVLFFAIGVFSSAASFRELQRPEFALRHFIRFVLAKVAVGRGMELMTAIFSICGSVVSASMSSIGGAVTESATLPSELVSAIESVGFLQSVPLWIVSVLGSLFITVMSFILILTVYGRFFKLYLYTAISPLPFASFAGENTAGIGKAFVKSYMGVCLEGAVIVLACLIYSAFISTSAPAVDSTQPAVTMAWKYIGELLFNMLVLTGMVKGADRIVMALRYSNSPRSSAFSHADASRSSSSIGTGSTASPRQKGRRIGGCSPPPIPGSTSALQRGTELRAANEPSAKAESPAAAEQALPERSKPVASYSSCQAPFKTFFY